MLKPSIQALFFLKIIWHFQQFWINSGHVLWSVPVPELQSYPQGPALGPDITMGNNCFILAKSCFSPCDFQAQSGTKVLDFQTGLGDHRSRWEGLWLSCWLLAELSCFQVFGTRAMVTWSWVAVCHKRMKLRRQKHMTTIPNSALSSPLFSRVQK